MHQTETAHHDWGAAEVAVVDLSWPTRRGAHMLQIAQPTLLLVHEATGGRLSIEMPDNATATPSFFGETHLSYLAQGRYILVDASEICSAQIGLICFDPVGADQALAGAGALLRASPERLMFRDDRLASCARLLVSETVNRQERPIYGTGLASASLAGLYERLQQPIDAPEEASLPAALFERVATYINDRLDELIATEALANLAGLSPAAFLKAFASTTGMSPQRWQMDERVRWAQRLMLDGPGTALSDIAAWTGFADQSHFSRIFKQSIGVTPSAWLRARS